MTSPPDAAAGFVEVLRQQAARQGEKTAFRFLADGEQEAATLSFAALDRRARAVAAFLQGEGATGERVLLLHPPGLEFVVSFLGCLYAGAVAVPAYPPRPHRTDARLAAIVRDARPRFALTSPALAALAPGLAASIAELREMRWLVSEEIADDWAESWAPEPARGHGLAFLQYTSGSTAAPKGVMVTRQGLLHNERMIQRAFGQSAESVIVGWLPLYHDMGLIGNVLQPLFVGASCTLMAPVAFLQRPLRWLQAISRYRATTSGGPDFAYDLCARKIDPAAAAGLDLSSWRVAFNGAEPVRAETLDRFAAAFAPCGFRRAAFYPCYGLAEATLLVASRDLEGLEGLEGLEEPAAAAVREVDAAALELDVAAPAVPGRRACTLVACGRSWLGQRLEIVDPQSFAPLPEGRVGEIWVGGPSVAVGYWNQPEATQEAFGALCAGEAGGRFLRTGDLGFVDGGELYVTGRLKDLLILRGRNVYPQDVERTAERSHSALRPGGGAAFAVEADGEERLVVVHEVERGVRHDLAGVAEALRRAVAEEHEAAVHAVCLIRPGALPRTSSGKVRRRACREDFLAGRLDALDSWRAGAAAPEPAGPRTPTEERLAALWREVFEADAVGVEDSFFDLGGDSLKATQLVARINEAFGVDLLADAPFTTPTVAGLAELLDGLAAATVAEAPPLAPAARSGPDRRPEPAPLSFAQRRLWFLHQLDPDNPVHNIAARVRLAGRLEAAALHRALDAILLRHEALRTTFHGAAGEPVQEVAPFAPLALPAIDLAALPAAARAAEAVRAGAELARLPFALESAPFLRAALLVQAPEEHELVLAWHHIAADGRSLGVFLCELTAGYQAFCEGRAPVLPDLPLQIADFALWQRRWLAGAALDARLAYWRGALAGAPAALELPSDRLRPAVLSHRGAHHEQLLPERLTGPLATLARGQAATPFMALLAGFAALLHRLTGQTDLVLGMPVAGRGRRELEGLIGVFLNNLVLRLDADGDPSFRQLLGRVRGTALAAYAHQDLPFEVLVDALEVRRDLSRTPLFQVLFVEPSAPLQPVAVAGLRFEPREVDLGTARFDLALAVAPLAAGWLGTWKYSRDLFDTPTPVRWAGHFESLLAAAAADPDQPLSRLAWLSAAERHHVLLGWNDTAAAYRQGVSLHRLIAEQAARTPGAVAVSFAGRDLTYSELEQSAGRLARRLRRLGVGPESLVGVAAERSTEMVVALVAILKAGGAYVPLDPGYPRERLQLMLDDAGIAVLLTQSRLAASLPPHAAPVLLLDEPEPAEAKEREEAELEEPDVDPDHPAYAIYTSGSTGTPKGAVIPHRGIVNRLLWMQEAYDLGPGDRVLQKTPFSFDVSVWEFFWPLITGARLVVAPPGAHQDPAWLARLLHDEAVTTLHFVPSMLQIFLEAGDLAAACRSVRRVITSGEALPRELVDRTLERLGGAALHNLYGPTEASVDVSFHACRRGEGRRAVPIGRPIANTALHVLDRHGQPVPAGVPGELHIGGVGLARGYLRRPALTAEKFVPDPCGGGAGARLYRTGDLARFRPDGALEFLGRLDHQVKIRGVRVELGEVEAALLRHPGVREAVVVARTGGGETRLVAYVVPAAPAHPGGAGLLTAPPGAAELRAALRERLPEAMVPGAFVVLPALPLTPSGKVDRRALPAPDLAGQESGRPYTAPRTPLEQRLAALWREQLRVERVGIEDSFFELGGNSIQGALLINRLQEELGEILYVMALFDAPTVAGFAAYLEGRYPEAAARLGGSSSASSTAAVSGAPADTGEALAVLHAAVLRRLGRAAAGGSFEGAPEGGKNPRAVFVLAPFRSGSTLFRVLLAGHPRLLAPPELELLAFATMGERARAYSGREGFAREGLLRAVMELRAHDAEPGPDTAEAARAWVAAREQEDLPVARFYRLLQEQAGGRTLVDKTPSYCLDPVTLRRAEAMFDEPLYIHLVRHPAATVGSYVEAAMDQVYGFPFPAAQQAELVWLLGHRNILDFLAGVPARRVHRLRFEDLVQTPGPALEEVCAFLDLPFEPAMLDPYDGRRMTDGLHAASRMMGDPKFHRHTRIEARVGERWREARGELWRETRALAESFGYVLPAPAAAVPDRAAAGLGPRPVPREPGAGLPLSYAQERLWFLAQLDPESPAYNMPAALALAGSLGPAEIVSLTRAFGEVRRRHEVLRTTFPAATGGRGGPVQEVSDRFALPLPLVDLGGLPAERGRAEQERLALAEGRRPFDLGRGPMLRTTLLRRGPEEHVLLVTLHHIVSDGWTIGVLIRELAALYRAFVNGEPSPLPELPLQYADYAVWQRRWLNEEAVAGHLDFWRRRLAGRLPALELPTDRPRPAQLTFRGARQRLALPAEASDELREWSRRQGTTPFLVLLAAFDALLHRLTGQDDLLLGIPIANRNRLEVEGLIGFFLNMVVQRGDASGDPAFGELLRRVSAGFLSSVPHQEVPFEKVVEALQPERDLSRTPIFQVQLSLQNTPAAPLALPGLTLELLPVHNRTTKFDATVFLFDEPDGIATVLEYNTDLFDAVTIERLLGHWTTLLAAVPAAAGRRLSDLPLLSGAEREQLLRQWNTLDALAEAAPDSSLDAVLATAGPCLHHLFEEQAQRQPRAVAVVDGVRELSYRQLDERANRLARRLRALGVRPEVPVALCVERSLDLIVGLLGILKAGGAYVPLDPSYPRERLSHILADALAGVPAPVVVTEERLAGLLDVGVPWTAVRLDADRDRLAAESAEPVDGGALPPNLAYVIYTSGSTGRPKGVPVAHVNAVRLLTATAPWFGFGPDDVWTLFHSIAFDFSVWEVWGALAFGGRLVIVPRATAVAPAAFHELLATEGVTVLNQTPSAFRALVRYEEEEHLRRLGLRTVIFGGEALELSSLAPWAARHGLASPRLVNMYGITETTVHVTYRPLAAADLGRAGNAPVGVPIPDLAVHLLGRRGELVPVGVPGEIHVGGAGVARGYLGRPDLTAERFVPDPFAARPGARLYRSGDLARRRPDGDLDYLGRIDHQVKVRGFRIELGEIEAALLDHPGVRQAVVLARSEGDDRRLVAYVVAAAGLGVGTGAEAGALRAHLRARLPEYMVPAAFVSLERLPLTPSGKVDRRALPDPEAAPAPAAEAFQAPRTATERRLAEAWCEVLRVERAGLADNFFDLGGHSLLVTQLGSRIRSAFGVELPIAAVFEAPVLAALAARIDALGPAGDEEAVPAIPPAIPRVPRDRPLPLSFAQERLWFLDQMQPGSPLYNVPLSLRLRGRLDVPALEWTFGEIVCRHEVLRTGFRAVNGTPVQVVAPEVPLRLLVADLSDLPAERREARLAELAEDEARQPFDLGHPPLLRVRLVRLAAEDHALLATVHHIASDGWSLGVLVREVEALYAAVADSSSADPIAPPAPIVPELPVQYADFAVWQRGWLQGEVLAAELAFWHEQLAGAPRALNLPVDRPRPPVQGFAGRHLRFTLPRQLALQLQGLARRHGASLFMALLAAFEVEIYRLTGRTDFLIGSPVANRTRREIEDLIGFFVNTLVLRARLDGGLRVDELLGRVREVTLAALARQDLPFEKLVQHEVERDSSRSPLVQVLFVLQNAPAEALVLPGLAVDTLDAESGTAKFDLTLSLVDTPQGLTGFLEYSTDLFEPATAARLLGCFRHLLEDLATDPGPRVGDLSLLGPDERRQLLAAGNDTRLEVPELPFHRLFEQRVQAAPAAPAVAAGGEVLTYAELNRRGNQLARRLRGLGVGPEVRIGIAVERTAALPVCLVAALKSGGAYVPLDPSHPRERLALILEDAAPAVLLTERCLLDGLPVPAGCRVLCLDDDWNEGGLLAAEPSADPAPQEGVLALESLAYLIFTSGSTGRPKGVQIPHGALANFLAAMARRPGLAAGDTLFAVTTVSFDIAVLELLLPLVVGARIELASREQASDGALLAAALTAARATVLQATPAGWRLLLDAGWPGNGRLKALCGGEALTPDLTERLLPRVGSLWNVYGPTETTVWSAAGEVVAPVRGAAAEPIGPPVANTALYVLDTALEPTPVGVPGELYIGGAGLARGYLGAPELTAERILPDPFTGIDRSGAPSARGDRNGALGARLYRTGDLARRRADGAIDFLGRADHQVKIRGFRIELEEVAAVLGRHPAVRQAVVAARPSHLGDLRLVAYVVGEPAAPGQEAEGAPDLRRFLQDRLPSYMVPADFVPLESFPLNASGKVDRRTLPAPETAAAEEHAAPETPTEELLVEIWEQALGRSPIGIRDNFFQLGGHSLLAPQIVARIESACGVRLPLRAFFETPTIMSLAVHVDLLLLQEIEALSEEEAEILGAV